ncbi:unnamed protein product [Owenia fusiformis]|uniref:Uncharacterized protein n=1 Tax=Owenia fusiformis TaxID=6347 RepID=A0A8J1TUV3_OWEFU|nr:unnamed protein product [Owenia fusiformis]
MSSTDGPGHILENVKVWTHCRITKTWTSELSLIYRENTFFTHGGMRLAYRAWHVNSGDWAENPMVLKVEIENGGRTMENAQYDVLTQSKCINYAIKYNNNNAVPKQVTYVESQMVEFLYGDFEGQFGTLERFLEGNYFKHNNADPLRNGYAITPRNTPQAFTHFTFEDSGRREMVVDIQGVGDVYTDPQIFTMHGEGDGRADWGPVGIAGFFLNHKCNAICRALKLAPINPTDYDIGTQPVNVRTQPLQQYGY